MSRARAQRIIQVRSDNRRGWCKQAEIVNFLGRTLIQMIEHGHTNEGFVLREGRFGRGVADDGVLETPERLDVDWRVYGYGHRCKLVGMRGEGRLVKLVPITLSIVRFTSARVEPARKVLENIQRNGRNCRRKCLHDCREIRASPSTSTFPAAAKRL